MDKINNTIDVVITYVNMEDEAWQTQFIYEKNKLDNHNINSIDDCRFRDWGTLKYVLRSIDKFASFVNNVFLVVQMESQVPKWLNKETVKVVLHEEFMPKEVLPTYSSCAIEMYLHLIPGLTEKFIYFNDDMILWNKCRPEDFFIGDMCVNSIKIDTYETPVSIKHKGTKKLYKYINKCSSEIAFKQNNIQQYNTITTEHNPSAFLKSVNNELFEKEYLNIINKSYQFRQATSLTQYMYITYSVIKNKCISVKNINSSIVKYNKKNENTFAVPYEYILSDKKQICVNDLMINNYSQETELSINCIMNIINIKLNEPCKYENCFSIND